MRSALIVRLAVIIALASGTIVYLSHSPARPATAVSPNNSPTAIQCNSQRTCFKVSEVGPATAVAASSQDANGVLGKTFFNSSSIGGRVAGVTGLDMSSSSFNAGVFGKSSGGFAGVFGQGLDVVTGSGNYGVWGETYSPSFTSTSGFGGLLGLDNSTDGNTGDFGVAGVSPNGTAVLGHSVNDVSVEGTPTGRLFLSNGTANVVTGVIGGGIVGGAFLGTDTTGEPALFVQDNGGSPLMVAVGSSQTVVMSLDDAGNIVISGTLTQNGTPKIAQRTKSGSTIAAYGGEQTAPTIETVGSAQLINGRSYVRLDPAFAATMDARSPYMVFVTPDGPSRGLYVDGKTPNGFSVIENPGGNASITFDYRIVARPLGASNLPLARLNNRMGMHFTGSKDSSRRTNRPTRVQ